MEMVDLDFKWLYLINFTQEKEINRDQTGYIVNR